MTARAEFDRLTKRAGVIPYRRVGRLRMAYDPNTPRETVEAAAAAVRAFAPRLIDEWGEPTGNMVHDWRSHGLDVFEVGDDPCPREIDPRTCSANWLIDRCRRYHFRLTVGDGRLVGVADDGWEMDGIRKLCPKWFVEACKVRAADLIAALSAAGVTADGLAA